jgi:hypothetical protein
VARRSGGTLLVRVVLAAVAVGVVAAASAVRSPIAPAQITGSATVAQPDPALPAPVVADAARPAAPGANGGPRRGPGADSRRDTTAQPVGPRRTVPTAANFRWPPPRITSPARSTTTSVAARSTPAAASSSGGGQHVTTATAYHGRNHVWIPSLRISRSVQSFPCSRSRPPDAGVYRWGCAGRNNVYLMSHAWSTFKPLHDAYVGGRLRKGMKVWYADGAGRVRQFRVIWWRVTRPTTAASWAWAAQSRPSMTLQTCVGARSEDRLMVRLVQVG